MRAAAGWRWEEGKEDVLFEKKNQKTFCPLYRAGETTIGPD
jgi:hypothetical protein